MPQVYNKHHGDAPADAVYIGRGSKWGNPYKMSMPGWTNKDGIFRTRNEACDLFEQMVQDEPDFIKEIKEELKGKDLVCFCKPKRCHGDTLLRIANE